MALGTISKAEGERMKATVREASLNFDQRLDVQRKNQLRKLRDVMNARRKKKTPTTMMTTTMMKPDGQTSPEAIANSDDARVSESSTWILQGIPIRPVFKCIRLSIYVSVSFSDKPPKTAI